MKKIEINELKQIELEMLIYIDDICQKNNLNYYLVGGSLLGAVRHKGFIPWDDDIDIAMPRRDFNKLFAIINNQNDCYQVQFYNNIPNYGYPFPKVVNTKTNLVDYKNGTSIEKSNIFIDIFICDGFGNTFKEAEHRFKLLHILRRMVFLSRRSFIMESMLKSIVFAIPCLICKLIGTNRINHLFNTIASRRDFYEYKYGGCTAGCYYTNEIFKKIDFLEPKKLAFEHRLFLVPSHYKIYLKNIYGNYMILPSIEQRMSNHTIDAWWDN